MVSGRYRFPVSPLKCRNRMPASSVTSVNWTEAGSALARTANGARNHPQARDLALLQTSLKLPIPDDRRGTPCGCPAGSHRSPAESPLHVAIPGARKDAGPSRRLESRRSTRPVSRGIMPEEARRWGTSEKNMGPPEGGLSSPPEGVGVGKPPLLRKTWGIGGGTFLSPSSPRLPSLGPGGVGVGRIGGGTFSPPVRVGVGKPPLLRKHGAPGGGTFQSPRGSGGRKTPTPFRAGFRRTGAGGGAPGSSSPGCSRPRISSAGPVSFSSLSAADGSFRPRSRTKTSTVPLLSRATRLEASDSKATNRPSPLTVESRLRPFVSSPLPVKLVRVVDPVSRSLTKMSSDPLVSPSTRLEAKE